MMQEAELRARHEEFAQAYLAERVATAARESLWQRALSLSMQAAQTQGLTPAELDTRFKEILESQVMIHRIQQEATRPAAMQELAERFLPRLQQFLRKKWKGREVTDLSRQAFVVLIENMLDQKFTGQSSIWAYLRAIAQNQAQKRQHKQAMAVKHAPGFSPGPQFDGPELQFLSRERQQLVTDLLNQVGQKCQQLLRLWMLRYSMREIARQMAYKNESVARNTKKRCFTKLLQLIESNEACKRLIEELR